MERQHPKHVHIEKCGDKDEMQWLECRNTDKSGHTRDGRQEQGQVFKKERGMEGQEEEEKE
jgi:hypothetical protein